MRFLLTSAKLSHSQKALSSKSDANLSRGELKIAICFEFRLQDYQTESLKQYFDQDALLVPIETIRGKYIEVNMDGEL